MVHIVQTEAMVEHVLKSVLPGTTLTVPIAEIVHNFVDKVLDNQHLKNLKRSSTPTNLTELSSERSSLNLDEL